MIIVERGDWELIPVKCDRCNGSLQIERAEVIERKGDGLRPYFRCCMCGVMTRLQWEDILKAHRPSREDEAVRAEMMGRIRARIEDERIEWEQERKVRIAGGDLARALAEAAGALDVLIDRATRGY